MKIYAKLFLFLIFSIAANWPYSMVKRQFAVAFRSYFVSSLTPRTQLHCNHKLIDIWILGMRSPIRTEQFWATARFCTDHTMDTWTSTRAVTQWWRGSGSIADGQRFHPIHVEFPVSICLIKLHEEGDVLTLTPYFPVRFPRSFRITYRLILREKELHFHIGVYNPSKDVTFSFNLLLHTYLKVPDVRRCQITGLHGCTFIDKVHGLVRSFVRWAVAFHFYFRSADTRWSDLPGGKGCCHSERMDWSSVSAYAARAHYHKCCVGQKNEATEIQFPGHRLVTL